MLPQNYQQKRIMDSMLRDYKLGKHFGLDKSKGALMDVMVKHNITGDINKLPGYKKEAFMKDVAKSGIGFDAKKAFHEYYNPPKQETKMSVNNSRQSYDEIMAKRKAPIEIKRSDGIFGALFGSNKKIMEAEHKNLIAHAEVKNADNYHDNQSADNYDDRQDSMDLIKRIQS